MIKPLSIVSVAVLAAAFAVGCQKDKDSMQDGMSPNSSGGAMQKPLEGNPGATTNQSAGYPQSDPGAYHPQTDDTRQYRPAPSGTIQPATH